ncbi:hypothetical protein [Amycolatopsis thermoflava]
MFVVPLVAMVPLMMTAARSAARGRRPVRCGEEHAAAADRAVLRRERGRGADRRRGRAGPRRGDGARLDEVASALDPVNESAVHEGIERLMAGRTVVMVAHRPKRRPHRLPDDGRIAEQGTYEKLRSRGGRYARFWNLTLKPAND